MIKVSCNYKIEKDIDFIIDALKINANELSTLCNISRTTLNEIKNNINVKKEVIEKIYSFAFLNKLRINSVKEELIKEKYINVLFHGSKNGLDFIDVNGGRKYCDFGNGFYLGETFEQALSFIFEKDISSVYSFTYNLDNLNVLKFNCDLNWMLTICFYRGLLNDYKDNLKIKNLIKKVEDCDVIIAPIADNRMFYIMNQFIDGNINANIALHSLASSKLGYQYVFKSEESLKHIFPIEKHYICNEERKMCVDKFTQRAYEIDTKLKFAKREFKEGLYIEEILK